MFFENVTNNVELETSERLKLIVISNSHKTFAVAWSSLANVALYTGKRYSNGSLQTTHNSQCQCGSSNG